MTLTVALAAIGALAAFIAGRRLLRLAVTAPALAMTTLASRYVSGFVGSWHHDEDGLLVADGADTQLAARRRQGLDELAASLRSQYACAVAWGDRVRGGLSDLRFTDVSRVPFPFISVVREKFNVCS